jgi:cytochrome c biogenesis protein CcmG/thiol:disulfide interchange protein DsbE
MGALQLRYLVPLSLFVVLAVGLAIGLTRDPSQIPSVLIDQEVPAFSLGPVAGRERGFSSADLTGEVRLVNFFASWCVACRAEHPLLNQLTEDGTVPVYGINYKDKPEDVRRWLDRLGDPYVRSGADHDGRVGIEWGVYGLPESFIVDRDGRIRYKHIGPIGPKDLEETIMPLIEKLRG